MESNLDFGTTATKKKKKKKKGGSGRGKKEWIKKPRYFFCNKKKIKN